MSLSRERRVGEESAYLLLYALHNAMNSTTTVKSVGVSAFQFPFVVYYIGFPSVTNSPDGIYFEKQCYLIQILQIKSKSQSWVKSCEKVSQECMTEKFPLLTIQTATSIVNLSYKLLQIKKNFTICLAIANTELYLICCLV